MERRSTAVGHDVGDLLPSFSLRASAGRTVTRHDYRGRRHLVLAFVHDRGCAGCRALLQALAADYDGYRAEAAEVLAFLPPAGAVGEAERASAVPDLPYPLLCDDDGRVRERYGAWTARGEPAAALLVADRHGEIVLRADALEVATAVGHGLPVDEVLPLVRLLQVRCAI